MGKRRWSTIVAVILALLWLQAEADRWQLRLELKRVYLGEVTVQTVDADTNMPIPITISRSVEWDQRWPKDYWLSAINLSKMKITWVDVGETNFGVTSEGYEFLPLTLSPATLTELVVPLWRTIPGE